jgi:hypothetical protein
MGHGAWSMEKGAWGRARQKQPVGWNLHHVGRNINRILFNILRKETFMKKNQLQMTMCRIITLLLLCTSFFSCSCSTTVQNEDTKKAMINLMNSYINSIKERNFDKTIAHFMDSPEFMFFSEGKCQGYNEIVTQVRDLYQSISKYEGKWDTIFVSALTPTAVAAVAPFHEVLTDNNGVETRLKGEVTWIAIRLEKDWKFIYGHASYLPDTIK